MHDKEEHQEHWTEIIEPKTKLLDLRLAELWRYRDLILMFVRRDFVANYKQTILGPVWFFIQPMLTTLIYIIVFGQLAGLAPSGVPMILFYLAGITMWSYFSETLNKTSTVFKDNAQMFGKVYFPRLTMPFSIVISSLIRFSIQLLLFTVIWLWYFFNTEKVHPNYLILLTPILIIIMALLSLGFGMIISAMTNKYKDLIFLMAFSIQLWMYATPVIYPLSKIQKDFPKFEPIALANPMTSIIETFRYAFLGAGSFSWLHLGYSAAFSIIVLLTGTIIFNKVEKSFTDTV